MNQQGCQPEDRSSRQSRLFRSKEKNRCVNAIWVCVCADCVPTRRAEKNRGFAYVIDSHSSRRLNRRTFRERIATTVSSPPTMMADWEGSRSIGGPRRDLAKTARCRLHPCKLLVPKITASRREAVGQFASTATIFIGRLRRRRRIRQEAGAKSWRVTREDS